MCYSAIVEAEFKAHKRMIAALPDLDELEALFRARLTDTAIKIPKAIEANFAAPDSPDAVRIKALIDQYRLQQATEWETALFAQRKRLANAELTNRCLTSTAAPKGFQTPLS